ncbi:alkaline phosphatase family protein [Amycolatopsis sp. NPDC059657]|uniref:alkaline phosphatase family protein n=1 Tax=Amycolatopsis sp. NPDC059657 TaxID=3346899 RepID=UPI003672F351
MTKILVVALDACDPGTIRAMAADGEVPTLARLLEESASATTRNPYGLFVGSLWSSFFTARTAARTGFHCWEEVDTKTYERRLTSPLEIRGTPFWETLSAAGKRVAVLDVPHSKAKPLNGVMVCEYACHDRHFGFHTSPPALAKEIETEIGLTPILTAEPQLVRDWAPDDYLHRDGDHRTAAEERALTHGLVDGIGLKTQVSTQLLAKSDWDLFLTVYGESHSIGHQQWHLHDPGHRSYVAALGKELDPIRSVYRELDAAIGEHLALVEQDTTVFVLLSHGMGPRYEGSHLLHELLRLLDQSATDGFRGSSLKQFAKRKVSDMPTLASGVLPFLRRRLARNPLPAVPNWATPEQRARQRYFLSPNNFVFGGVRINLEGREPSGVVKPTDYDAVCDQLTEDLLALVNVETGEPVVRAVSRTSDHYDREADDSLPDLLIDWGRSGPIETVWSAKTGVVHGPDTHWRTGDHRPGGLLLASGPGFTPGTALPDMDVVDFGSSLSAMLGVTLDDDTDGRVLDWATSSSRTPARSE